MSCNCQLSHSSECPTLAKKEAYRQAKRSQPLIDNPYVNWECDEQCASTCKSFKPYPPRMTEKEFQDKQTELLQNIPEELHSAFSFMAWDQGHPAGYEAVTYHLQELVNNLSVPLAKLVQRLISRESRNNA